jgi:hypothetical protein
MSVSLRVTVRQTVIAAAVVILAAGGTVAGVAAASVSPGVHPAAAPAVDHQLCYPATAKGFKIPKQVVLEDQFSPKGFQPEIGPLAFNCNPTVKILPTGQEFKITHPNDHLACFKIAPPTAQPTPTVQVTNQFGTAVLVPGQPNLLCLPSWKSLTGPPGKPAAQPPGLSHFTCYPVRVKSGAYQPPAVMLQDEFASAPINAKINPVPAELCLPTEKIVAKHTYPVVNAAEHLLCFPVSQMPIRTPVYDQNQFGTATVTIGQVSWLCVPSTKKAVSG